MTDQTPLLADGLLGWPGFGPGGSQQFKAQRLYTGDIWYAPRSGFYFIIGAGGGGGGNATSAAGGSGATLFFFPLFIPEGDGGIVTIGSGGAVGANGTDTSIGTALILGGGNNGGVGTGGASGTISGHLLTTRGYSINSQGTAGSGADGEGGSGGFYSGSLTGDLVSDINNGRIRIARGGLHTIGGPESYGAGGGKNQAGTDGGLIIAWVGTI